MKTCVACGHELGIGRFCTNCGHPVDRPVFEPSPPDTPPDAPPDAPPDGDSPDWRTDTAERSTTRPPAPAAGAPSYPPDPPRIPPAAVTPPPPPRYPLYADEVQGPGPAEPGAADTLSVFAEEPGPIMTVDEQVGGEVDEPERRSWLTWVAVVLALALLAVGGYGLWAIVLDDSSPGSNGAARDEQPTTAAGPTPANVAPQATAVAPETAPPNEDVDGNLVSYDASNMLDGVPETAWRTTGDATGMRLTFRLASRTTLSEVGMINGYTKKSTDGQGRVFDWYRGNRRVEAVVWDFGNSAKVRQELGESRELQSMPIEPVTTRKVVVRLVGVSAPGTGRAGRDYTASSEVSLVGLPA